MALGRGNPHSRAPLSRGHAEGPYPRKVTQGPFTPGVIEGFPPWRVAQATPLTPAGGSHGGLPIPDVTQGFLPSGTDTRAPCPGGNIGVFHHRNHAKAPPSRGGKQGSPIPRSRRGSPLQSRGGAAAVPHSGVTGVPHSTGDTGDAHPDRPAQGSRTSGGSHEAGVTRGTRGTSRPAGQGGRGGAGAALLTTPTKTSLNPAPPITPPPLRCHRRPPAARRTLRNVPPQRGAPWVRLPPLVYWGAAGGPPQDPSLVCCRMSSA